MQISNNTQSPSFGKFYQTPAADYLLHARIHDWTKAYNIMKSQSKNQVDIKLSHIPLTPRLKATITDGKTYLKTFKESHWNLYFGTAESFLEKMAKIANKKQAKLK